MKWVGRYSDPLLYAIRTCDQLKSVVCTKNLNPDVVMVKSTKYRV